MTYLQKYQYWTPFEEMNTLRNRIDRVMSRFFMPETEDLLNAQWTPTADVINLKDAILVRVELPGVTEKDINVELENGILTIKGEKKFEKETKEQDFIRTERNYGQFLRSFTIPMNVIPEKVTAAFVDGVLEIHVPKKEEAKPRTIKVEVKKKLTAAAAA